MCYFPIGNDDLDHKIAVRIVFASPYSPAWDGWYPSKEKPLCIDKKLLKQSNLKGLTV